LTIDGRVLTTT